AIRSRHDPELVSFCEIRARRTVLIDDSLREKVQHPLVLVFWLVRGEKMIEAAIFAHDDNQVLDGCNGGDFVDGIIRIGLRLSQRPKAKYRHDKHRCEKEKKGFVSPFACITEMHTSS